METEASTDVLNGISVPAIKVQDEEGDVTLVPDADENPNQSASAKSNNTVIMKSNKSTSEVANASKEKMQSKPKTRVVQSRFRSGLSNSKNSSGNSRNGSSNNDSNNKNDLNCTMKGPISLSDRGANRKVGRGSSLQRNAVGKSMDSLSRNEKGTRSASNAAGKPRPARSTMNLNESRLRNGGAVKPGSSASGNAKLHSTVLAERTMLGGPQDDFSTTLVGGIEIGKARVIQGIVSDGIHELPELPDISAIRLDSSGEKSDVLSRTSEKDSSEDTSIGSCKEITQEDLQKEYLRYLQAAYIDVVSEEAFNKQLGDLKTQLVFLDQLTNEKQIEVMENKQKLELLHHHQDVYQTYKDQTDLLRKLSGGLPDCESALEVLTKECAKNLHQVKMDNLYIPTNHTAYRDQLSGALKHMNQVLGEVNSILEPDSRQLTATVSLMDDLKANSLNAQQYEREVNQAARLAIQEASLQIVAQNEE